jgi:hypothetical protein
MQVLKDKKVLQQKRKGMRTAKYNTPVDEEADEEEAEEETGQGELVLFGDEHTTSVS